MLSGFQHLTVLDLDTIDVSNLNRQFLFRRDHVGKSKAEVARESVLRFHPAAQIIAIHGNIKEARFDQDYFAAFDLVLNALDNLEARRHVNRLCLSSGRTLCESGTQGYAGQTTVIRGRTTECFECVPAPSTKTFAVCTIRNTPDKPVHCIVWAKALYAALFGPPDEGNILSDAKVDLSEGVKQAQALAALPAGGVKAVSAPQKPASYSQFARSIFHKLFNEEIHKQREVKDRWKERTPPEPLELEQLLSSLASDVSPVSAHSYRSNDQSVLSAAQDTAHFLHCIDALLCTRASDLGSLEFDKDDQDSMDFVSLAANLRMRNFSIPPQSRFGNKGVAGNIVHAIASTNAIAAGLMTSDAIKVLQNRLDRCKTMWISRHPPGLLTPQALQTPSKRCFVCAHSTLDLTLHTGKWTLKRLYEEVLKKKLSMIEPGIDVINRDNFIGTEEDHEDSPSYLSLPLSSPSVKVDHNSLLSVEDQQQSMKVQLRVVHREEWDEETEADEFTLTGEVAAATTGVDTGAAEEANAASELAAKAGVELSAESKEPVAPSVSHKRKLQAEDLTGEDEGDGTAKKAKLSVDAPAATAEAKMEQDPDIIELD